MTTLIATVLTWILTGLSKNAAVSEYANNRALLVRMLAAMFALASAFLVALLDHSIVSSGIIGTFLDAVLAWLAAIGLYHVPASTTTK